MTWIFFFFLAAGKQFVPAATDKTRAGGSRAEPARADEIIKPTEKTLLV